ncbi:hypothetical protein BDZ88DRAFT_413982 [Geranomyces variabilis]|nr:hypothetical protein BDZ88DRAFT_413982 [Geranomyces variabilis]
MVSSANLLLTSSAVLLGLTGLAIAQVVPPVPTVEMPAPSTPSAVPSHSVPSPSVPFSAVPFPSAPSSSAPSPLLGCGDLFAKFNNNSSPLADCYFQAEIRSGGVTSQRTANAMLIDVATCQCPLVLDMKAEVTRYTDCSQQGGDFLPLYPNTFMRHCQIQDYPAAADDSGFLAFPPDYKKGGFHWRYRASGSNGTLRCSDYKDLLMDAWKPCTKMATDYITSHLPISQSTVNAGILLVAECSCPSLIELFREDIADIVSLCPAEPNFWIRGMDVSQAVRDTVIAACRNKDYKSVANAAPQFFIYTDFDAVTREQCAARREK